MSDDMRATPMITSPLKWHGGKHYLASRIVSLMPAHKHYVEPYAGGLAVMLAKGPEGVSEVANDIHHALTNFWKVLQDPSLFMHFCRVIEATPFSEAEWLLAKRDSQHPKIDAVSAALAFFILCRQSMAGRMESFAPLSRRRTRRGMNEQASAWLSAVEGLPAVHARLQRVVVLNRPALEVIRTQDGPDTLFYLDPPYVPESRSVPEVYDYEMTFNDHVEMLEAISNCQGHVMLSGYHSSLYDRYLAEWTLREFDMPNNAAGGGGERTKKKSRMTECVWCNF